jgi:PAS domain S-box-containing protein
MSDPTGPTPDSQLRTRDLRRAIVRLIQELEAIDWYHAPIGVVAVDVEAVILAWNGVAGELLGVREWEVLGTPLVDLFEEEERPGLEALLVRCIATDTRCTPTVFSRRRPDGSRQFVEITATGMRGRAGEPGATVLLQDVTSRVVAERLLAEAERRYRTLVQRVDAIVWEADPATLRFTFVSQRAEDLLGYPVVEWLKDPEFLARVLHPEDRGRTLAAIRTAVSEGKDQEIECRMLAADGREIWVRDRVTVVRSERGVETVLGLIVDVTERKRTEQALARLYQRAEDESKRKDEFLAILGHELRTPLGTLANAVHLLRSGDRAAARAAVDAIARATHHLTTLTRDLFDIASVVSGKLQLDRQPVDLGAAVAETVRELQARARKRGQSVVVSVERGVVVEADPVRLAQIVSNLVDNALKYSGRGARCEVSVRREGGDAVLVVRDQGRGIAADDIERIFEPFYQAGGDGGAAGRGGLGLGLALVRRLVELHGGSVRAESGGAGRGSQFVVRLPQAGPSPEEARPERVEGPRVLVIEDDTDMREILKTVLEREGYRVEVAEDGPRGIEKAQARPPDAALVDIGLPGLGGLEVAPRLRAPGRRRPYLIAITGYSESDDERRARAAGFDAYLVKPVDPAEVVRLVGRALRPPTAHAGPSPRRPPTAGGGVVERIAARRDARRRGPKPRRAG